VLQHGLDATMDQLAAAGGVSRRTLFRHFETREKLLAAAFEAGITGYRSQLPSLEGDVLAWLRATCESAHRMNSTIGPGFFELASRTDLPPISRRPRRVGARSSGARWPTSPRRCGVRSTAPGIHRRRWGQRSPRT
jgi:AcrR family transcriptional regulator